MNIFYIKPDIRRFAHTYGLWNHLLQFACTLMGIFLFSGALAQSNPVRVTVQVLPPYSNNIYDYIGSQNKVTRKFQEQVIVTLQNTNPNRSYEIKLLAGISGDNGVQAKVNASYQPFRKIILPPGELKVISGRELSEINLNISENDITTRGISRSQLKRTGTLPEGNYRICIQAFDFRTNEPLSPSSPMGCSPPVHIAYPDPPVIVYPFDKAEILAVQPQNLNISWATAPGMAGGLRYRVRIVEMSNINADPNDVMTRTGISFFEEEGIPGTSLFYGQDKPQFRQGFTYALRVQAYDPAGELEIKNNGWSEIYTFTYVNRFSGGETVADIDYINLKPGFLRLVNLEALSYDDRGNTRIYNGRAELEISAPGMTADRLSVVVRDLAVRDGNPQLPEILDGTVTGEPSSLPEALGSLEALVAVEQLEWNPRGGLRVRGLLTGPDGKTYRAGGGIQMTQSGLFGSISTSAGKDAPLFVVGENPVEYLVTGISASFPSERLVTSGYLRLFGDPVNSDNCTIDLVDIASGNPAQIHCKPSIAVPLYENSNTIELLLKNVFGSITPHWESQSLSYDLQILSRLGIKNSGDLSCGTELLLQAGSETGLQVKNTGGTCLAAEKNINLGLALLYYDDISVESLVFDPGAGWDFELAMDAQLMFPAFGDRATPVFENLKINRTGVRIPAFDFGAADFDTGMRVDWGGFDMVLTGLQQPSLRIPIEDMGTKADWNFTFAAELYFSEDSGVPVCLKNTALELTGGHVDGDGLTGQIETKYLEGCQWEFGPGYALDIRRVSGELTALLTPEGRFERLKENGALDLTYRLLLGAPFACTGDNGAAEGLAGISFNGGLNGTIQNIIPPCALNIGPFEANISESSLTFRYSESSGQQAFLEGGADLDMNTAVAEGTFGLDLMTGKYSALYFNIDQSFRWDVPRDNPALSFTIGAATIDTTGLFIDGRHQLSLGEDHINTTFDNLRVDLYDQRIQSGKIIFDSNFAVAAEIGENSMFRLKAVAPDYPVTASPALLMELAGNLTIDSSGLKSSGTSRASLHYGGRQWNSLAADYNEDFTLHFDPFGVSRGQVDFYHNQQRIAFVDASGFHPDYSPGLTGIPERIPLPSEAIAYLQVKEGDQVLVDVSTGNEGVTTISTKPGQPLQMVLPALQGHSAEPPALAVEFEDLMISGTNGEIVGGSIIASVPEGHQGFDLGIPLNLEQVMFGINSEGDADVTSLWLNGRLQLFERDLGNEATVALSIQADGHLRGTFDLPGLHTGIPLLEDFDQVRLSFSAISGFFDVPLLGGPSDPDYGISFSGEFIINNALDALVAKAELAGDYSPDGFTMTRFEPYANPDAARIDLDYVQLQLNGITSLDLDYDPASGISFNARVDCAFGLQLRDGGEFIFPLEHIEISNHGFSFPDLDIHAGSVTGFDIPAVDFGAFSLKPLAFRLPETRFNWFDWHPGDALNLLPAVDLELRFPSLQYTAPAFSQASVTLLDIGFTKGILTGSIEPFVFPEFAYLPISGGLGINVGGITGGLGISADGLQAFDIKLEGRLRYPDFFNGASGGCMEPEIMVSYDRQGRFSGVIEDFTPCAALEQSPLTLQFNDARLAFAFGDRQKATLSGSATATIKRSGQPPVTARGDLAMDLVTGTLLDGSLQISGPFAWNYPSEDSLFRFTVQTARLDTAGLVFHGGGAVKAGTGSSTVSYHDLTLNLSSGKVTYGRVNIDNSIALNVAFNPVTWSVTSPDEVMGEGLRMVLPPNLVLDKNGLTVNGNSSASLHFAGETFDLLTVDFEDFNWNVDPAGVRSGMAAFYADSVEIAYYDKTGFNFNGSNLILATLVPDTLALPSMDIAYIVLRDGQGNLLVDVETAGNGKKITSRGAPLQLVLPTLDDTDPPTVEVTLTDVILNDGYEVVQGSIVADLTSRPLSLIPFGDIPLNLERIKFEKQENKPFALYADASLQLPGALNDMVIDFENIAFGPDGFKEGTFSAGTFKETYDPGLPALISETYENGAFQFSVTGVELSFGQAGNTCRLSGNMGSNLFNGPDDLSSRIHVAADYQAASGWDFHVNADHLPNLEIPVGRAKLKLDNLGVQVTGTEFALMIDARLTLKEVMGDDFEIGINGLKVGSQGASVEHVNTNAVQYLSLFNEVDNLRVTSLDVSLNNNSLFVLLDGSLHFMEKDLAFTGLRFGSDGTVNMGGVNTNLLSDDYEILDRYLVLTAINLTTVESKIALQATGEVNLPEPFVVNEKELGIAINHAGDTEVTLPNITAENIPAQDIAGFTLKLTDYGLTVDPQNMDNNALYASAELTPPESDYTEGKFQFGTPSGSIEEAGISYRYGDGSIRWNITGAPRLRFEKSFFKVRLTGAPSVPGNGSSFGVAFDADAGLAFDGVEGTARMNGIRVGTGGLKWGTFAGGSFKFIDAVSMELGAFTYQQGGTIEIERKTGEDVSNVSVQVDEYLHFGGDNGGLDISIDDMGLSGGIHEVLYYRTGETFHLAVKGVEVTFSDYARLTAGMEYIEDNTGMLLRVAGGAEITPPGTDPVGVSAVGKISTINNELSFGIFVATSVPIPILPGLIELSEIGGGFFYNATSEDLQMVQTAANYDPYHAFPFEEGNDEYDFAVLFYGGAGVLGSSGAYLINGKTFLVVTDKFITMDATFTMESLFMEGGAYISVELGDKFILEAGGGLNLTGKATKVVDGGLGVNFVAVSEAGKETIWAFTGGTNVAGGKPIGILGVLEGEANIIVSNDGFLLDCTVGANFPAGIVDVSGHMQATIWYRTPVEQFGAYVEVGAEASLFWGAFVLGGTARGALIIERSDFLIYASLTGYVEVLWTFEGDMTLWVSVSDDGFDGGTGNSGYDDLIAQARDQAGQLNENAENLLASIENAKSAIMPLSDETLTKSGQSLYTMSSNRRERWGEDFINNEKRLMNPPHFIFQRMRDGIVSEIPRQADALPLMGGVMDVYIDRINNNSEGITQQLQGLRASAIGWEATAAEMATSLRNPVSVVNSSWSEDGLSAPSYSIDEDQAAANQQQTRQLQQHIGAMQQQFKAAIDSTLASIHKIEAVLYGNGYTLSENSAPFIATDQASGMSINEMAESYHSAYAYSKMFYAHQIAYFWALHNWSKEKVAVYGGDGPYWNNAKEEILRAVGLHPDDIARIIAGTGQPKIPVTTIAGVLGERRRLIQRYNPDISQADLDQDAAAFEVQLTNDWAAGKYIQVINAINRSTDELYDMQILGLTAIRDLSEEKADSLVDALDQAIGPVEAAYADFTRLQDNIYNIKHAMTITLHGMMGIYAGMQEPENDPEKQSGEKFYVPDAGREPAPAGPASRLITVTEEMSPAEKLEALEQLLLPPSFSGVSLQTYKGENGARGMNFMWNADHPYKNASVNGIVENSFTIAEGTSNTIYDTGFMSVGDSSDFNDYAFPENEGQATRDYTVRLRARGPAGNTITRVISETVPVASEGPPHTFEANTLEVDDTPPSRPVVRMDYHKNESVVAPHAEKYWSNIPEEISFSILATDNESDITRIEYALGTSEGAGDVVTWTTGYGRFTLRDMNSSMTNAFQEVSVQGLSLKENTDYYLSVRVTNGEGLTSAVTSLDIPLRLDLAAPTAPERNLILANFLPTRRFILANAYQENVVRKEPDMLAPPAGLTPDPPRVDVAWRAGSDGLSGVRGYQYILSDKANVAAALETGEINFIRDKNIAIYGDRLLSFTDSVYIHVWSEDYGGNRSQGSLTFALLPADKTAPATPVVTIMPRPDEFRLYLTRPSYDLETKIKGFQYAVGTTPGATDVKGWPEGDQTDELEMPFFSGLALALWKEAVKGNVDWAATQAVAPYYKIPIEGFSKNTPLYVQYRTVNHQGKKSAAGTAGPVMRDITGPERPVVSFDPEGKIIFTGIKDEESGIKKVECTVDGDSGAWEDITPAAAFSFGPLTATKIFSFTPSNLASLPVGIRITNGNGMQCTYWFNGPDSFLWLDEEDVINKDIPENLNINLPRP